MDNRYYENVIAEMKQVFEENGFILQENGNFNNESKSFSVKYDEARQMYTLSFADLSEDAEDHEYKEINAWLFDDSQNAKDASSVGIDFASSVRKQLGIKTAKRAAVNIDLPTAGKNGSADVTAFTKKMLDIYPSLKDNYKEHISVYGNFLYINFFGEYLVPCLKSTFETATQKQIKKLFDVLDDAYVKGNKDTVNILVAVLCATAYGSENITGAIRKMLESDAHFLAAFDSFAAVFPKKKKIFTALVK